MNFGIVKFFRQTGPAPEKAATGSKAALPLWVRQPSRVERTRRAGFIDRKPQGHPPTNADAGKRASAFSSERPMTRA